jgi:hypothetical protein
MRLPLDGSVEAEYADGYIHSETELDDISPYDPTRNILNDVLEKRPEAIHGQMVRFSMFYKDKRYDIDWVEMPDSARPIRYKKIEQDSVGGVITETRLMKVGFGYQYTDGHGHNVQEVEEL